MTVSSALATGTVRWSIDAPGRTVAVAFVPSVPLVHAAAPDPTTVILSAEQLAGETVTLNATDDPDVTPTGWTWVAHLRVDGVLTASVPFLLPSGQTVDLAELAPVPASAGVTVLRGPAGASGPAGPAGPTGTGTDAALPNLWAALAGYDDAAAPAVRLVDVGSSVGLGPGGTADPVNAVGARLFTVLAPLLNPLGNVDLAHHNGSVGGSVAADWLADYDDAKAAAGGAPALLVVLAGMNDGMPAAYHAGQTFPGFAGYLSELIGKAQRDGCDVLLCTTPHPHTGRMDWSYGGPVVYPGGQLIPDAAGSVEQIRNAAGVLVPASYRHRRINDAMRLVAAQTGSLLLDAEHYWLLAVAEHGEDALFDPGQDRHPNLLGFQSSYFRAIDDLAAALAAPTVRAGVIGGQRNPVPVSRTGAPQTSLPSGGTLTVALPPHAVGRLTVAGTSGGGWHSVWAGSFITTGGRAAIAADGSAFTAPGQLIESVTGSDTDTTVAVKVVATGSGSNLTWAADYFSAF